MDADYIQRRLSSRHANLGDCYLKELPICGCGRRMDGWVITTHLKTIGYEIKVSRQDFRQDKKWKDYIPYCDEFYFVCPPKIIFPDELEPEAGLVYVREHQLRVIKKCDKQKSEYDKRFLLNIIQTRFNPAYKMDRMQKAEYYKRVMENDTYLSDIGDRVGDKIRKLKKYYEDLIRERNKEFVKQNNHLYELLKEKGYENDI